MDFLIEITQYHKDVFAGRICPYCKHPTVLSESIIGTMYWCKPCDAYNFTADDGKAVGRVANRKLRDYKVSAYGYFNAFCEKAKIGREVAYNWLSWKTGIPPKYTNIEMFNIETCKKVIELCSLELYGPPPVKRDLPKRTKKHKHDN